MQRRRILRAGALPFSAGTLRSTCRAGDTTKALPAGEPRGARSSPRLYRLVTAGDAAATARVGPAERALGASSTDPESGMQLHGALH